MDLVSGPKFHAVDLGMLVVLSWKCSPDHLVLVKLFPTQSRKELKIMSFRSRKSRRLSKSKDVAVTYPEDSHFVMCLKEKRLGSSNVPSFLSVSWF